MFDKLHLQTLIDTCSLTCSLSLSLVSASGHIEKFTDCMVKDAVTGVCHRADHLLEDRMDQLLADANTTDEQRAEYTRIKDAAGNMNAAELDEQLKRYNTKVLHDSSRHTECHGH
jgi:glycyl-tRNA synthetase (class II)